MCNKKMPGLTPSHTVDQFEFTKYLLHWTVDDWMKVMSSDETSISHVGSFGRKYYYSNQEHKHLKPTKSRKQSRVEAEKLWYGVA